MDNKVVLIGCGNVGMAYAYALVNQKDFVTELILIDTNRDKADGEAMDLSHCAYYSASKMKIRSGSYNDCKDAKIVVIAAGANQAPGETRMDLISKNSKIFKDIIQRVVSSGFRGIFLVATNPLDVMTYLTLKYSSFPKSKVLGSGTTLDTARLRYILSEVLNICPKDIEAYVIGEHGDSEFIPWSNANVASLKITEMLSKNELMSIEEDVRTSAYNIINKKGATAYGIGMSLVRITNAIIENKNIVLPVSSYDSKNDVCISTPAIVGANGVEEKIYIPLDEDETKRLEKSIEVIKDAIKKVK